VPAENATLVHLELQLHQCVLTLLEHEDDGLVRRQAVALPGVGLIDLQERWARHVAAAFIQQARFDPMHTAATEQQLFDRLPEWLARLDAAEDIGVELQVGAHRHQARLRAGEAMEAVQPQYAELFEALAREGSGAGVLLGARIARLPRFAQRLPEARVLGADAAVRGALANAAHIRSEDRALRFVTRLQVPEATRAGLPEEEAGTTPAPATTATTTVRSTKREQPTHLLCGDRALPLAAETLQLFRVGDGLWQLTRARSGTAACQLLKHDGAWYAQALPGTLLRVDGLAVTGRTPVAVGTRLAIEDAPEMRLIAEARVHDDAA